MSCDDPVSLEVFSDPHYSSKRVPQYVSEREKREKQIKPDETSVHKQPSSSSLFMLLGSL